MLLLEPETRITANDGADCLIKQPIEVDLQVIDPDASFWSAETGSILQTLLSQAEYSTEKQEESLRLYNVLAQNLGRRPTNDGHPNGWYSFMTDDFSPIEFSWHWGGNSKGYEPAIRLSVEPIGRDAGSIADPYNAMATMNLIDQVRHRVPGIDLQWFDYFSDKLIVGPLPSVEKDEISNSSIDLQGHKSTVFLAFEFVDKSLKLKAYLMPLVKALRSSTTITDLLDRAIIGMKDTFDPIPALDKMHDFLRVDAAKLDLSPLMVAVDCVDPGKARLKVYARTPKTSFRSVLDTMNHFEDFVRTPNSSTDLRTLWQSVLGLEDNFDVDAELPSNSHKTSGILYYFEVDAASPNVTPKLYIPVKHYGRSDLGVASGLGQFFEKAGWEQQQQWTGNFLRALEDICTYRNLNDEAGLQTYISCGIKANRLDLTSYISPQIYHRGRWESEETVAVTATDDAGS